MFKVLLRHEPVTIKVPNPITNAFPWIIVEHPFEPLTITINGKLEKVWTLMKTVLSVESAHILPLF